jgi:hypothetical protein
VPGGIRNVIGMSHDSEYGCHAHERNDAEKPFPPLKFLVGDQVSTRKELDETLDRADARQQVEHKTQRREDAQAHGRRRSGPGRPVAVMQGVTVVGQRHLRQQQPPEGPSTGHDQPTRSHVSAGCPAADPLTDRG